MLLDQAPEATAILAMSDRHAVAVLAEQSVAKINSQRICQLSVFDDAENAIFVDPPLTTMAQPTTEKGRIAARILFEDGPPKANRSASQVDRPCFDCSPTKSEHRSHRV